MLVWEHEREEMVIFIDDEKHTSYSLGSYLPQVVRQLTWWGVRAQFADRAVNAAREFRKVQAIPSQDRVINLIDRSDPRKTLVAEQLSAIDSRSPTRYIHL